MPKKDQDPIDLSSFRIAYAHSDARKAEKFVRPFHRHLFGSFDVEEKMARCPITSCFETKAKNPAAYICLNNHPVTLAIPPWEWEYWVHKMYGLKIVNSWNTMWIHLLLWNDGFKEEFLLPILEKTLQMTQNMRFVLLMVPPFTRDTDWLEKHGTRLYPKGMDAENTRSCQTLILFMAENILPKYKIRKAVEEDNDDIVELLKIESNRMTEMYGDFYIAEILVRYPECGRQIIVAEYEGTAIGVLCVNENVNLEMLKTQFETTLFLNFMKFPDEDIDYLLDFSELYSDYGETVDEECEKEYYPAEENVLEEKEMKETRNSENLLHLRQMETEEEEDNYSVASISSLKLIIKPHNENLDQKRSKLLEMDVKKFYIEHLYEEHESQVGISNRETRGHSTPAEGYERSKRRLDLYMGEPNAFVIELASIKKEHEGTALLKLLSAAFECFPNRDFALTCLHSQCFNSYFNRHFNYLTPRPNHTFKQCVYVQHRDQFFARPTLRQAELLDYNAIQNSTKFMKNRQKLLEDFTEAVCDDNSELTAYVLCLNTKIVGAAIVRPFKRFEEMLVLHRLKAAVNFKVQRPYTFGEVIHAIKSPIFNKLSYFLFIELHRMTDFSMFFYEVFFRDTVDKERNRIVNNYLDFMLPIRVQKRPEVVQMNLTEEDQIILRRKNVPDPDKPLSIIFTISPKLIMRPVYHINDTMVVVGAGDTALAFLESLLCNWSLECRLLYTNITVVSPHGLDIERDDGFDFKTRVRKLMFPFITSFQERWAHIITIRCSVNQVHGVLSSIDRKNKIITINDEYTLQYDTLFLMCGEQFQRPNFNPRNILHLDKGVFPKNVFIVNTPTDAEYSINKLQQLLEECETDEWNVIVYGSFIEAYCCLNTLLAIGIPGEKLVFIDPPVQYHGVVLPSYNPKPIPDSDILDAVQRAIVAEGIDMYLNYELEDWYIDPDTTLVTSARFLSKCDRIEKECNAMFVYCQKAVSSRTFMAINKAGLIYDGGLVIGSDGRTNDPCIFAAGTMTKYSRKYYADHLAHRYFNSEEVGYALGSLIGDKFMESAGRKRFSEDFHGPVCEENENIVSAYSHPLTLHCKLPGNLNYLRITKPGKYVTVEVSEAAGEYGKDLVTGNISDLSERGYFKIHLDSHNKIETITCLSHFKIDKNNMLSVWGKHESLFNKLLMRYEMGLIDDFADYFRQTWSFALYQDDFVDQMVKIMNILYSYPDPLLQKPIGEHVIEMHRSYNWKSVPEEVLNALNETFTNTEYPTIIGNQIIEFISDRVQSLPMYMVPVNDKHILFIGNETSPLFREQ